MIRFLGKVAVVTGFGSGIGRAVALLLAAEGAHVAGLSRNADAGNSTVETIRASGGEATFIATDVRYPDQVDHAIEKAVLLYGGVDIAVNAAGVRATGSATEITAQLWEEVIATNLNGSFYVARSCALHMRARGGGAIVNVSAISGFRGPAGRVAYGASKAGVHNLTEAMGLDYAHEGIRVNCVAPGPTATPMVGAITPEVEAAMAKRMPIGHIGQPEDVAEAVAFLASDAAKHVTGAILPVTGGAHLNA